MEFISNNFNQWLNEQQNQAGMSEKNNVLNLRLFELAHATKPFRARGFKLKRCDRCLISKHLCLCSEAKPTNIGHRFILIMYRGEAIKPSNTGRLIAEILPNTLAFPWSRTELDHTLINSIMDKDYETFIVFPSRYAYPEQTYYNESMFLDSLPALLDKKIQFIILDGTWSEAKKMFRKSQYLRQLPLLSIDESDAHQYLLREASRKDQLGTVSVALSILKILDEKNAFSNLMEYTEEFFVRYLSSKARNPIKLINDVS